MTHNPFPDPAAVLPGETAMLSAVLANLTDDLPKLVYADWLEERGDPRGVFLRAFTTAARSGGELPTADAFSKVWVDLTGCRAVAAAKEHELPITPDELLKDALPALTVTGERAADRDPLPGESKFCGGPDVPPGFVWPEYRGRPMSFLAQFNLSELSASPAFRDLPRDGLLSVFYAAEEYWSSPGGEGREWEMYHFPDRSRLARRELPAGVYRRWTHGEPLRLTFVETLTLPTQRQFDTTDQHIAYRTEVCNANTSLGHQLFGHPRWLHNTPGWATGGSEGPPTPRHLLTLDSDNNAWWSWGDAGLLYFGIAADDLKAGRFDRTLFVSQCC